MGSFDDIFKEMKKTAFTFIAVLNAEISYVVAKKTSTLLEIHDEWQLAST